MPAHGLTGNSDIVYDPTTGNADGTGRTQIYATNDPNDTAHYNALCTSAQCMNMIPTSRISPAAAKILDLQQQAPGRFLPAPARRSPATIIWRRPTFFDRFSTDDKVNWNATDKFTMYGHVGYLNFDALDPQQFGAVGGTEISGFGGNEGHMYGYTATTCHYRKLRRLAEFRYRRQLRVHAPDRKLRDLGRQQHARI